MPSLEAYITEESIQLLHQLHQFLVAFENSNVLNIPCPLFVSLSLLRKRKDNKGFWNSTEQTCLQNLPVEYM